MNPTGNQQNILANRSLFRSWSKTYDFSLFQFWMRRFQVPVLGEVDFTTKGKLLDISCGTGQLLRALEKVNTDEKIKLVGIDLSPEMLEKAREKLSGKVTLKLGDVHSLPFASHSFNYVVSTEAFHHYGNQQQALQEMVRVARPGGVVMVVDINFLFRFIHWLFERFEPGCQKVNSRKELLALFQKAGIIGLQQQRRFLFAVLTKGRKG